MNNKNLNSLRNRKKILIADDDASILEALEMILEDEGYDIQTSLDGKIVKDLKENLPDLILLDIWLSGMDGRDICKHLKNQEITRNIPIIMISANRDTEQISKEAGAEDFIAKPFEIEDLLAKVKLHANA